MCGDEVFGCVGLCVVLWLVLCFLFKVFCVGVSFIMIISLRRIY